MEALFLSREVCLSRAPERVRPHQLSSIVFGLTDICKSVITRNEGLMDVHRYRDAERVIPDRNKERTLDVKYSGFF